MLTTLFNVRPRPRALRSPPSAIQARIATTPVPSSSPSLDFEADQDRGVLVNEVGEPRNDGTRAAPLYSVPFKRPGGRLPIGPTCSSSPGTPPSATGHHRPGIA